ncbi:hypothetical protein [Caballeronia sp. AAUFL_F2_KS46]|uniref:hypothetical protein n=1 Tax=Caballeronia sp. AAUFL_F2_KS46 TaxID=2921780 RepID=UPI0020284D0D|nr:hypothetical protein [Caballeronia sp. AAUFL_F2_KS46]
MKSLMALLSAYDALNDKRTFYAQGLRGVILEREACVRADGRGQLVALSSAEGWTDARLAS